MTVFDFSPLSRSEVRFGTGVLLRQDGTLNPGHDFGGITECVKAVFAFLSCWSA